MGPDPVLLPSPGLQSSQDRAFRIEVYNSTVPGRGGSAQRRYTRTDQRTGMRWIGPDVGACATEAKEEQYMRT